MRIAVISDTHIPRRARDLPRGAWDVIATCAEIIHAGDVVDRAFLERLGAAAPLHVVRGNNDRSLQDLPESLTLTRGDVTIAIIHDPGPSRGRRERLRRAFSTRVVVFGHSHVPVVDDDGDLLLLNPGSPTDRRSQPRFTMAVLTVANGEVDATLVDLGLERARS